MRVSIMFPQSWYVIFSVLLLIVFLGIPLSGVAQTTTPTDIRVTGTVLQPTVTRLGINLGDQSPYDSGQMMKNLIFGNSGFEGMKYRSVLHCVTVTANTCRDGNTYSNQPSGFWTGGTYRVISGARSGITGNIVESVQNPAQSAGYGPQVVTFDKSVSLAAGDYVVVTNNFPGNAQEGWASSLTGAATFATELVDLSSETPGKQALRMIAAGADDSASITRQWDLTDGHTFLQMNGAYQLSFRAKGVGGSNQVSILVNRLNGKAAFLRKTISLTPEWADYNLTFTADEDGTEIGRIQLAFAVAKSAMLIDDVSLTQTNSDSTNTTAFRDDVVDTLNELQPGTLRMNAAAATGADLYDQIATPFARYREGASTNSAIATDIPYGIPEFLQLCAAVGAEPWLTISAATTPQEIADFMDYLQGSGSTTYSALRVAQGQVEPWTSVFKTIHIELGNETWNNGLQGDTIGAQAYALWANQVFGAARKSANFDPARLDLVVSGSAADPGYSQSVLQYSRQHDSIDMAPYLAGNLNQGSTASLFRTLFAEPEWFESPGGTVYQNVMDANEHMTSASGTAKPTKISVYETNIDTPADAITQTRSNELVPSVGVGVALANHMLQMMRLGVNVQNSYNLPGFGYTGSNGNTVRTFGLVVDMGPNSYRRPSFLAEALANTAIQGSMLSTVQTGANPTWNPPLSTDGVQLGAAHEIQSFAFLNGTSHSVVLFNLSLTNSLPVTFSGVDAPSGTVQVSQLTSANITDNNETSNTVQTNSTTATISLSTPYVLPPYSMTVLSWTSDAVQASAFSIPTGKQNTTPKLSTALSDASAQTTVANTTATPVFNCSSGFASSGSCGVAFGWPYNGTFATAEAFGSIVGTQVDFVPAGTGHSGNGFIYQTPVNDQAFSTTFTWVPNGFNFAFVIQNNTNGFDGGTADPRYFSAGAGGESGFYQGYTTSGNEQPNNVFAIELDSYYELSSGFNYSSVQMYQTNEAPYLPAANIPPGQIPAWDIEKISTAPVPLNSPSNAQGTTTGDTYSVTIIDTGTDIVLSMYDVTAGGSCPGASCFTYTWNLSNLGFSIPSIVGSTTAHVGFTNGTGETSTNPLYINSWSYTVLSAASAPTYSPVAGTYGSTQSVSLTSSSSGAVICYNTTGAPATNGSTGCANGTLYTGAISVSSSETLYAVAGGTGSADSAVSSAAYKIGSTALQPTFYPATGTYQGNQTVFLSAAVGSVICYNTTGAPATNGSTGCTTGTLYTGPITVSSKETLYAAAGGTGTTDSGVGSAAYVINAYSGQAATNSVTYSPLPGSYSGTQSVTLSSSTPGSYICYVLASSPPSLMPQPDNTGGTAPGPGFGTTGCNAGTRYTGPITVSSSQTLYAMAGTPYLSSPSALTAGIYTIGTTGTSTPTFSPAAGTYISAQSVSLADATSGATIYYTTDGTTPTTSSTKYTAPITVSSTETIEAIAAASGYTNSSVATATYTISPVVAMPVFSVAAGTYTTAQTVTITDATAGTTIYYTTNGSTPTTSSTVYTGPITVSSTETLEAIAVEPDPASSAVASATYTINPVLPTPTFTPAAGTYTSAQTVTISDATAGTTIYYTTNGSTPTTSSTVYSGPITVSSTETLEAIAVESGYTNSAVATAAYTITTPAGTQINYGSGFASSAGSVVLNGSAKLVGSALELTDGGGSEAGTAWYATPVNVQSFTTNFTFQLTSASADGFTFAIQNQGTAALGAHGGALGYTPIPTSVAVKFDLYNNGGEGNDSTGLYINGAAPTEPSIDLTSTGIDLHSGDTMSVQMAYDGTTLTMTITDTVTQASFTTSWAINIPSTVGSNTAYVGFTGSDGGLTSIQNILTWNYSASTTPTTAAMSTFTPAAGTYTSAQTVTISDATAGTTIYYTTNGSTPTTSSTKYTAPITVSSTETIEAIAAASGYTNSAVATAAYTIDPVLPTPTLSVAAGTYTTAQTVTISDATAGTTIYYTTNGSTPTTSSTVYSGPITVSSTETLEAIAVESGYTNSALATAAYTITTPAGTQINYGSGFASSAGSVVLNGRAKLVGSALELTDGGENEAGTAWYATPVNVQSFTTNFTFQLTSASADGFTFTIQNQGLSALGQGGGSLGYQPIPASVAVKFDLYNDSGEGNDSTGLYINGAAPTTPSIDLSSTGIDLHSGDTMSVQMTYDGTTLTMTITDTVTQASFTTSWAIDIPTTVGGNTAYVGFTGGDGTQTAIQNILTWNYSADATPALKAAMAMPTFTPAAGTYSSAQTVTISDATAGTTIYYTTNGSTPTTSSAKYTGAIAVSSTETLEAIAVESGYTNSAVAAAAYTINPVLPTPTFSVAAGTYTTAQTVTISDATAGTTIYYTTNGTTPTTSSTRYGGAYGEAITVSSTETIKAIAVETGYANSPVASAAYTISAQAATPAISPNDGTFTTAQTVTISDATPGAAIYYTTDGTTPSTTSSKYTSPITVSTTETLQALAMAPSHVASPTTATVFTIQTASASSASSPIIGFGAGFASAQKLIAMNGSAQLSGSSVQLTLDGPTAKAGSVWYATPVNVQSFTTNFTFQLTNATADGFTFTIQNQGTAALGKTGGGLGYLSIPTSVAVKFDLYNDGGEGNDSTGLYTKGAAPMVPSIDLSSTGINLHSGDTMTVQMVYNGTALTMTITDTVTKASYTTSFAINIPATVGGNTAYVGFTGGIGALASTQAIRSWTYSN
jgi:hypothetical protein